MAGTDFPSWFTPLFIGAFVTNMLYTASVFALSSRLKSPALREKGAEPLNVMDRNPAQLLRFLKFVFSDRHHNLGDAMVSRLTLAVRLLFGAALIGTFSLFALALGLM